MTKVFEYAETEMLRDKPLKEKKLYFLNKWIDDTTEEIGKIIQNGCSPDGVIVALKQKHLIKCTKLRGELLK